VPTKTRNKIPAKPVVKPVAKPTVIASATPKKAPINSPITVKPATPVATVAKAITKTVNVASKIPTKTPATGTVASVARDLPIWAMKSTTKNASTMDVEPNKSKAPTKTIPAKNKVIAKAKVHHDAVVHRTHAKGKQRVWTNKAAMRLANIVDGKINGSADLSAVWQTHWDKKFLYVRVDAVDDKFMRDSKNPWGDDSIEIYIDADGSRSSKFDGKNDFHFIYRWKDKNVNLSKSSPRRSNLGIQQTMTRTNKGYSLETAIPWRTLGVKPIAGKSIGIDVQVNDDDTGNNRDGKLSWHAKSNDSWSNPRNFGQLVLGI
jgi:hypothetical protein